MFNHNGWKNFKAILFGLGIALLLCEIFLRIYNPFPFALQKGRLVIPANISREYDNQWIPRLYKKSFTPGTRLDSGVLNCRFLIPRG